MLIIGFAGVVAAGTVALLFGACRNGQALSVVDALFTATSAVCVTGLAVVDTGTFFSHTGHWVILVLIQLGGLGIMTYTSLALLLWRRRVKLSDRLAVRQTLLHDPTFSVGRYLWHVALACVFIEALGAMALNLFDPGGFTPFSALFHAVSAFCNAGFALQSDSLMRWASNPAVNLVFMLLIILGGLGFAVLLELAELATPFRLADRGGKGKRKKGLSWHTRVVLVTSLALVLGGALWLYLSEFALHRGVFDHGDGLLTALFQSVTCRTAGFNTMNIGGMANVSLLAMMAMMFIGGSPGSCAGGVKTTTFRALLGFCVSRLRGRRQSVVGRRFAMDPRTMNDALTLSMFAIVIVGLAVLALSITETGTAPHGETRGMFLELLFECVSAFGTVGLSTGLTPTLTTAGKLVVTLLMFVGRLGPIVFITVLHDMQHEESFRWPEKSLPIG